MNRNRPLARRGNVLILVAILLVVLFAMVAFAIDIGYVLHARTELQRTADVCALAAAMHLPDESAARQAAVQRAEDNRASIGPSLDVDGVVFGHWDRNQARFAVPPPAGESVNAVRVRLERTDAAGSPLRLFFAGLLGVPTANAAATATAMYDRQLCGPFIGIQWLSVPGNPQTDSYDSSEGNYDASRARERGSLCSDGPIYVDGRALVRGDARAGMDHKVQITGSAQVTRSVGSRLKPLNLPPVDASAAAHENDNHQVPLIRRGNSWHSPVDPNGDLLLDGTHTLELPPGTYYFRNVTLKGQSTFNVSGPTTIYVVGDLERSGGAAVNNFTKIPANLQFQMTGGTANVTSGNDFYGVIYAPHTDVTVDGSSDLYGAVVGRTLIVTGSGRGHYDEALALDPTLPRRVALVD